MTPKELEFTKILVSAIADTSLSASMLGMPRGVIVEAQCQALINTLFVFSGSRPKEHEEFYDSVLFELIEKCIELHTRMNEVLK